MKKGLLHGVCLESERDSGGPRPCWHLFGRFYMPERYGEEEEEETKQFKPKVAEARYHPLQGARI